MSKHQEEYVPALSYDFLTPLYDVLIRLTVRERAFKSSLLRQAGIRSGHRALDLGCGTATMTIMAKKSCPDAEVFALDGDARILEIARRKAARSGAEIKFDCALSFEMPYNDDSFDRIVSSLFFHHLTREGRKRTLAEAFRALRPGGELHIADWGKPSGALMKAVSLLVMRFDGADRTADNFSGMLPSLIREAGFEDVEERDSFNTVFGTIRLLRARKPESRSAAREWALRVEP